MSIMDQALVQHFTTLLQLSRPPVGLAFVEEVPQGIPRTTAGVPSACTFWRLAEQGVFYAVADDHRQCPIGMITQGFLAPQALDEQARALLATMTHIGYFSPAEIARLPVVKKPHEAIVYGRLDRLPLEPDVILCILDARQAMLVAEAEGSVSWLQGGQVAFGRPTCGVIPRALQAGQLSLSFGCTGARTYVELTPAQMILALPAFHLTALVERLATMVAANEQLSPLHQQQKARCGV